ncbi:GDSL-type esterase/lipase family protein [Paenibacillus wynnii]|uniref:GDSL-type esterase/lipase family protein n=1 Tax=Paenibacillus wynnii TaxID=268407 RepID=UPI00278D13F0|nr:GDSL-type esterase/lipase family protein [Paenibacillus wynnii]MDQ0194758.1 lysophospholipase L1-like esterase [Paenibacillus wynnii]
MMGYRYTAIGDSLTTGFGALPGNGFVPVYSRMAEASLRSKVVYTNLGVNGLTTVELEQRLRGNSMFRQALQEADLITLSIGGNDLIRAAKSSAGQQGSTLVVLRNALQECKKNFDGIMGTLWQLKRNSRSLYIIRIVGLYNPYPRLDEASDWVMQFNRHASQYNSRSCGFASIYNSFAGNERELLFLDHIHPNKRGHYVIAEKLNNLGYGML